MSVGNLIAFLICIFFSANTQAQDADVPVPTITNTTANPVCGETVNLTAGGVSFVGYKCHWFSDAACTNEINTGVSGTYRENLAITITDGLTIYCRLRKDDTKQLQRTFHIVATNRFILFPLVTNPLHSKYGVHRAEAVKSVVVVELVEKEVIWLVH